MRILKSTYLPIVLILLTNFIIGTIIVHDFGESRDEAFRYRYAVRSLAAYKGEKHNLGDEKGAFYVIAAKIGSDAFHQLLNWPIIDGWHFMHFLSFLFGLFFLYILLLQFIDKWAATAAVLVFNTQPLLFGHAFINPKDIPFMAFFLASVSMGFVMVDSFTNRSTEQNQKSEKPTENKPLHWSINIQSDWKSHSKITKLVYIVSVALLITILIGLLAGASSFNNRVDAFIRSIYNNPTASTFGRLFQHFAENAATAPVEGYIHKAQKLYNYLIAGLTTLILFLILAATAFVFQITAKNIWERLLKPFLKSLLESAKFLELWAAGILLGFASSIRILGPASGILVSLYFLYKKRTKAIPPIFLYALIGIVTMYLTWPNLWGTPLSKFLRSSSVAANFPWEGKVLFAGMEYAPNNLPRIYLPTLLSIQFTIPAVFFFIIGFAITIIWFVKRKLDRVKVALIAAWFVAPAAWVILFRPTVYDNFRHFLFIIPPLFVLSGIGLQALYDWLKSKENYTRTIFSILTFLLILPNTYWIVKLHPYEYVHYNQFVGGVQGAFGKYEMDYWTTSYKEAAEYVNIVAPKGANVVVWGPAHNVEQYIRKDISVEKYHKGKQANTPAGSYIIVSSNLRKDLTLYPHAQVLFQSGREGAIYSVVKQISSE